MYALDPIDFVELWSVATNLPRDFPVGSESRNPHDNHDPVRSLWPMMVNVGSVVMLWQISMHIICWKMCAVKCTVDDQDWCWIAVVVVLHLLVGLVTHHITNAIYGTSKPHGYCNQPAWLSLIIISCQPGIFDQYLAIGLLMVFLVIPPYHPILTIYSNEPIIFRLPHFKKILYDSFQLVVHAIIGTNNHPMMRLQLPITTQWPMIITWLPWLSPIMVTNNGNNGGYQLIM